MPLCILCLNFNVIFNPFQIRRILQISNGTIFFDSISSNLMYGEQFTRKNTNTIAILKFQHEKTNKKHNIRCA